MGGGWYKDLKQGITENRVAVPFISLTFVCAKRKKLVTHFNTALNENLPVKSK
jgi:hypothetical protein